MQKFLKSRCVLFQLGAFNSSLVEIPVDVLLTFFLIFALVGFILIGVLGAGRVVVIILDVDLFFAEADDDEDGEEGEVDE